MALLAMLFVTLTQVSAVGFCESSTQIFVGQHKVDGELGCSHDSHDEEHHPESDCSGGQEPCEDSHLKIDLEVDDFVRSSSDDEHVTHDNLPVSALSFFTQKHLRPRKQILPTDFARPPPDLPVFVRFGVMRL